MRNAVIRVNNKSGVWLTADDNTYLKKRKKRKKRVD